MSAEEIKNNAKEMILDSIEEHTGSRPKHGTVDCDLYILEHKTCKGCDSRLGCLKIAALLVTVNAAVDTTKKFGILGLFNVVNLAREQNKRILEAKTIEELNDVMKHPV